MARPLVSRPVRVLSALTALLLVGLALLTAGGGEREARYFPTPDAGLCRAARGAGCADGADGGVLSRGTPD